MTLEERTNVMVSILGEVCTKAQATRTLGRSINTITRMLEDGRIEPACEGTMVDVRSIARYIQTPKQIDFDKRLDKRRAKAGQSACAWRV